MRPSHFQKPEAALQRAQEFISVGKEKDALQSLHDMIKDRRHKQWSQTYEQIMLKYVELCVNLRNSSLAKDGLYQYKIITQQIATKSLETVLEKYINLARQRTIDAQKSSIEKIEEIDDLDAADAPESLLLSVVSGAVAQDRMDRTVLSPWLRFLWDSYRNCLDLLRNNVFVEQLYHQIARQSFEFCKQYQRRNEFRKLCEMLRLHLGQIQKAHNMSHSVKLNNVESLAMMMETRLIQLDTAIHMELWQEAFKSAEDLHNMMQLGKDKDKKIVKPTNYVHYYDKIALVFWKGGNTLFHAAALLQKFNIYKDMKKTFSDEEAMDQATRVLLATLSIPDGADNPSILTKHLDIEEQHHTNIRVLSALLRLPIAPTRAGLFKEIARLNLPELAAKNAYNLYKSIEVDFNPLRLASVVQKNLDEIDQMQNPEYSQYATSIKSSVATKVMKQLATVYDSLSLERFSRVIPFYSNMELEHFLVDVSKHHSVKAQVDHREQAVRFGSADATLAGDVENEYIDEQETGFENVRNHISSLYDQLHDIVLDLDGERVQNEGLRKLGLAIKTYNHKKDSDYERILMRRKKIESYKENTETLKLEKLRKVKAEESKLEEERRAKELKRLELENKENEKRRRLAEQEEIQKKIKMDQIKKIQANPLYHQILKDRGETIFDTMEPEAVLREQRERMDAERREQQNRLQQQEKKFDHSIRAYHLEEMIVRQKISEERQKMAPVLHEEYETRRIEKAIQDRENSFITYERLQKAKDDAIQFLRNVIKSHADELTVQREQWQKSVAAARDKALQKRAMERKKARRAEAEQKKQEEQRRLAEEQQRAAAEPRKLLTKPPPTQQPPPVDNFSRDQMMKPQERRQPLRDKPVPEQRQQQRSSQPQAPEPDFSRDKMKPRVAAKPEPQEQQPPSKATPTAQQQPQAVQDQVQPEKGKYVPPHLRNRQ